MVDKQKKLAIVTDVAILTDNSIRKKKCEKLQKYQGLREELKKMWSLKATLVSEVTGGPSKWASGFNRSQEQHLRSPKEGSPKAQH